MPSFSPTCCHPGEALPEYVVCAVKVGLGEGDGAQAELDQGDKPWEVERAIQLQAFLEQAPRRGVVVVDVAGDHPQVMQTGRGDEGVSGRSGQCQTLVQQCRRGLVLLLEPGDEPRGKQRIGRASLITDQAVEGDAFLQRRPCCCVVALGQCQLACAEQCLRSGGRRGGGLGEGQEGRQQRRPSVACPRTYQKDHSAAARRRPLLGVPVLDAPAHRCSQVGVVGLHPVQPGRCRRAEEAAGGLLGERQEVVDVPLSEFVLRAAGGEPLQPVFADGFQHSESGLLVRDGFLLQEQAVPMESFDAVHGFPWRVGGGAQLLDRRQAAAAVEDGQ